MNKDQKLPMTTVFVNVQAPHGRYRHYFESQVIKFVNQITMSIHTRAHTQLPPDVH